MNKPELRQSIELLYLLVLKDLKVRYKSSILGYLWAIANPFAFAFVYWVAFKFIMRVQMENYSIFLISGMFPWIWLSTSVIQAARVFRSNSSLVKKVNLSRAILPLSVVVQEMVHFLFALPVIILFIAVSGGQFIHMSWIWQIPLLILTQLIFVYPLALIFSMANVFVHDVEYMLGVAFSMLFFAMPMVYTISMVPPNYRPYFEANPIYTLIQAWRTALMDGVIDISYLFFSLVWGSLFLILAFLMYRRLSHRLGERL
jgi:lipopolysaccharide transport system permease protein